MNAGQLALIKKDISAVTANRRVLATMLILPIVLAVFLPTVWVLGIVLEPESLEDFRVLLDMMPSGGEKSTQQLVLELLLNKLMPVFFLMIPLMVSSVMSASSFVGEKEKRTLETLLYSPLSLKQLFRAKILAGFSVGMVVAYATFALMLLVIEAEVLVLTGAPILPDISWLIVMLLIAPAISFAAIALTVRSSAGAQTVEESQQNSVFLIFPLLALIVGQVSGIMLISSWLLLVLGVVLVVLDVLLIRSAAASFTGEKLLMQHN